jgi:hypothetical protein
VGAFYEVSKEVPLIMTQKTTFLNCQGNADPGSRAVYGVGLQPLDCWDRGFESR